MITIRLTRSQANFLRRLLLGFVQREARLMGGRIISRATRVLERVERAIDEASL